MKTCSLEGCERPVRARGWCNLHWKRWKRTGDPLTLPWSQPINRVWPAPDPCRIEGCERKAYARGWCRRHYFRWRRHGDPVSKTRASPHEVRLCTMADCQKPHHALGWCNMHHKRWRTHGDPLVVAVVLDGTQGCKIGGCTRKHSGKGWCDYHYKALNDPEAYRAGRRRIARRQYQGNPEKFRRRSRVYRLAHVDRYRAYGRIYAQAHPDYFVEMARQRRIRIRGATVADLTPAQWQAIKQAFGQRCAYCGKPSQRLTQDHITPLSKGGDHTLSNVVPACRPCNSRKRAGAPLTAVQPLLLVI